MEALLAAGVKVNAVLDNELTLLMWAAGSGQDKMVQFLLAQGADKAQKDNRGLTALAIARDAKQEATVALLELSPN
jgi:ankyrin repeat protein